MTRIGWAGLGLMIACTVGCAGGGTDPGTFTAFDPTNSGGGSSTGTEETGAGPSGPVSMTSAGSAEVTGDPPDVSCCEVSLDPGCGNPDIESCVCVRDTSCCMDVWNQDCVDLAGECGDPGCPAPMTTGMPPGDSSGDPPMVTCDQLAATEGWMYYRCQQGDSQCNSMGTPTTDCDFCCEYCGDPGDVSCGDHATDNGWPPGSAQCEWNGNGACGGQGYSGTCDCDFCCQI